MQKLRRRGKFDYDVQITNFTMSAFNSWNRHSDEEIKEHVIGAIQHAFEHTKKPKWLKIKRRFK